MDSAAVQGRTSSSDQPANGGRRAKAAGAFRTISEVADELDVAQHVLRFWESKFPQVRPLKRGGGRRYYRPEDVDLLRRIRSLLYEEGYTIKGAQKLLKGQRRPAVERMGAGCDGESPNASLETERLAEKDLPSQEDRTSVPNLDPALKRSLGFIRTELAELRESLRKLRG